MMFVATCLSCLESRTRINVKSTQTPFVREELLTRKKGKDVKRRKNLKEREEEMLDNKTSCHYTGTRLSREETTIGKEWTVLSDTESRYIRREAETGSRRMWLPRYACHIRIRRDNMWVFSLQIHRKRLTLQGWQEETTERVVIW